MGWRRASFVELRFPVHCRHCLLRNVSFDLSPTLSNLDLARQSPRTQARRLGNECEPEHGPLLACHFSGVHFDHGGGGFDSS
jgi:hypothetical protein